LEYYKRQRQRAENRGYAWSEGRFKECPEPKGCGRLKPYGAFHKTYMYKDGHHKYCKPCWKKLYQSKSTKDGYFYIYLIDQGYFYRAGRSDDPKKRFSTYKSNTPRFKVIFLIKYETFDDAYRVEKKIFRDLKQYNIAFEDTGRDSSFLEPIPPVVSYFEGLVSGL
jgi:hypothetical protein